jgi:hypothetical protein
MFSFVMIVFVLLLVTASMTACTPEGELVPWLEGPISVFVQSFIEILIVPLLVAGLAWAIGQVKLVWRNFQTQNPDEAYWISFVINSVVLAAEQMSEAYPDTIKDKKEWAIERAEAWFAKVGIELDLDQISDLIEAEVKAIFNSPEKLPEQP